MEESVLAREADGWVEITLNRPERLNSFNDEMHGLLRDHIDHAQRNGARALLLTGAGRGFCAGQDLGDRNPETMDGPPDLGHTIRTFYAPLIRAIRSLEMPVICAVNGVAAGAGANIALACDIVLAAESAKFIQSFSKVGLIPDAGGTWMLPRLIGEARAKAIAMTAAPVSATQAEAWGMIWKALPDDDLMQAARDLTSQLAKGATLGLAKTKAAMQGAATTTLDAHLEIEADYQKLCGESDDYREGVIAFLNKRTPQYQGR